MRCPSEPVLAAAVLLAVLTACAGGGSGGGQASTPSTIPSPTPGATTTPFAYSTEPLAIEPGTYRIPRSEWSLLDFTVTIPEGWAVQYGHVYLKHADTDDELGFYAVVVDAIYADACEGSNGELMEIGPSVNNLAAALLQQRDPLASGPVDTTLGGYSATRVDLTIPEGFDLAPCNLESIGLQIWYSAPADKYFVLLPDAIMSVYIVDVDGQRQVFLTGGSTTSDEDMRELQAILDSIQIESWCRHVPGVAACHLTSCSRENGPGGRAESRRDSVPWLGTACGASRTNGLCYHANGESIPRGAAGHDGCNGRPCGVPRADPVGEVTEYEDLAYGPAAPGNLLDLYVPDVAGDATLPLLIWHSGSAWFANEVKDFGDDVAIVEEFKARGYAVASLNIRSSSDARFPAQGFDVRAAIRYLRENAAGYGIDPGRFAFMGDSSGGWATAFAATTSGILELDGETGVDGTSSAVQVAVAFFAPTDFLSMDEFAAANNLPMEEGAYPHDLPTSAEGLLVQCPGEGPSEGPPDPGALVSIQDCRDETEKADPASYIDGVEVPIWLLHGLADPLVPFNQSQLVYDATTAEGNEARFTLVPSAGHAVEAIIEADEATTWATNRGGRETETVGAGPSWDEIEEFMHANLERAR